MQIVGIHFDRKAGVFRRGGKVIPRSEESQAMRDIRAEYASIPIDDLGGQTFTPQILRANNRLNIQ